MNTLLLYSNANNNIKSALLDNSDIIFTENIDDKDIKAFIIEENIELCHKIKEQSFAPIFLITSSSFSAEFFNVIKKPIKLKKFLSQIKDKAAIFIAGKNVEIKIGTYLFSPIQRKITSPDDKKLKLTEKESEILKYLYELEGKEASKAELLEKIWGYKAQIDTHTLETHIYKLRKKIEEDFSSPQILTTGENGGYVLKA